MSCRVSHDGGAYISLFPLHKNSFPLALECEIHTQHTFWVNSSWRDVWVRWAENGNSVRNDESVRQAFKIISSVFSRSSCLVLRRSFILMGSETVKYTDFLLLGRCCESTAKKRKKRPKMEEKICDVMEWMGNSLLFNHGLFAYTQTQALQKHDTTMKWRGNIREIENHRGAVRLVFNAHAMGIYFYFIFAWKASSDHVRTLCFASISAPREWLLAGWVVSVRFEKCDANWRLRIDISATRNDYCTAQPYGLLARSTHTSNRRWKLMPLSPFRSYHILFSVDGFFCADVCFGSTGQGCCHYKWLRVFPFCVGIMTLRIFRC